jgi:hypothetical protein
VLYDSITYVHVPIRVMSPLLIASPDLALEQDHLGGSSSAASATDGDNVDVNRSFSSAPTEDEGDGYHSQLQADKETACVEPVSNTAVLPAPVVSALRLFDTLWHPRRCGIERQNTEIQEIDISRKEYCLLWWLLGQREGRGQVEGGRAPRARQPGGGPQPRSQPPKSAYLPLLRQQGIGISSVEELHDLGRWVLDSVRYEFGHVWDAAVPNGQIKTRLYVRMPLYIHDKFASDVGRLLEDSIKSYLPLSDVHAHNGFKCRFTDKFYQMMEEEEKKKKKKKKKDKGQSEAKKSGQTRGARSPTRSEMQSQPPEPTGGPRTRSRSSSQILSQPVALAVGQGQHALAGCVGQSNPGAIDPAVHQVVPERDDAEKIRYDEASPDVCVYIGDEDTTLIPAVIVEIGFSHPLPFDRARSYIHGSDGRCRVVICLDIEYRDSDARHRSYEHILTNPEPGQDDRSRPPPYGLTLNLFRCKFEVAGEDDTYAPAHELRDIDVREGARLGKALELKVVDLTDLDDDSQTDSEGEGLEEQQQSQGDNGLVTIPYADIVKLLDKTAWGQALRDNPSMQPSKKRKRKLVARPFTASPEPDTADGGRGALVKRRRASGPRK